jgi:NhaA family Na+:H+ antiporter
MTEERSHPRCGPPVEHHPRTMYTFNEEMDRNKITRPSASRAPIERLFSPFQDFFRTEVSGGIVLLISTAVALVWANSPWSDMYFLIWHTPIKISLGEWMLVQSLHQWINDGLMVIFFLLVGLEIKREILVGELSSFRKASLPFAAAAGGMIVPALIYTALNAHQAGSAGWGIPMATDIAFTVGIMALMGDRICFNLKIFLTALAIVDDLGAVIVIALFYSSDISWVSLVPGAVITCALMIANLLGIRHRLVYGVLGFGLWLSFYNSGIHPTVAGIVLAFIIPARPRVNRDEFLEKSRSILDVFEKTGINTGGNILESRVQQEAAEALVTASQFVQTPLQRIEHILNPWVTFFIIPVFALTNAGIPLSPELISSMTNPVSLGIICGLVLGKQAGITLFTVLAVRTGLSVLPRDVSMKDIYGMACLAGIGFTMSFFVTNLAFEDGRLLSIARLAILTASSLSAVIGWFVLSKTASGCNKNNTI